MHGKGYRPDPDAVVQRRPGFHILKSRRALSAASLPLVVDWSDHVKSAAGPGILDQDGTNSCTGHATAGAITTRFAIQGRPIPLVSPIGCYTVGRALSRQPNADDTLPPLTDNGAEPSQVLRGIAEWGVCSAETWGNYPANPATINAEPNLYELEATSAFELIGAYFLSSWDDVRAQDLMTAIATGYPVTCAVWGGDPKFDNYTGGILGAMTDGGLDHYVYAVGYTWDGLHTSSLILTLANSWGTGWGESGFARVNRAFVDQMADCCVIDVTAVGTEL